MRKRLPCVTQTSLDAFKRLATVVLRKFQDGCRVLNYFENRINDINLFYNNLSDEEKALADQIYNSDLQPVFNLVEPTSLEQRIDTVGLEDPLQ